MSAVPVARRDFRADRIHRFTESVIREMTRLALDHDAVNLAQGFPDFPAPFDLKRAAIEAIEADHNQYSVTWGAKIFRDAVAAKYARDYALSFDPEREITVCCGATEGMLAALLALVNADDEVIVFEPFYENYAPDLLLAGAVRKVVRLQAPDWSFDPDELRRAFSPRTRAVIVTTPNNPTGKVFSRKELTCIAELCQEFDALAITDEIYEHITFDGHVHIPMISLPGMRDRTVLVNSLSKTFSVTGWRVGWVLAAPDLTNSIRKVHDFMTVNAPTPLQHAGARALTELPEYFSGLSADYAGRRTAAVSMLEAAGFRCFVPQGAYYIMADFSEVNRTIGAKNDTEFAHYLVEKAGIAGVPGSSFYSQSSDGFSQIRFCFCKKYETLSNAGESLKKLRPRVL